MRAALAFTPTSRTPDAAPVNTSAAASAATDVARPGNAVAPAKAAQLSATARPPYRSTAGPATNSIAGSEPTLTNRSATPSAPLDAPVARWTLGSTDAQAPQKSPSARNPASVPRRSRRALLNGARLFPRLERKLERE